MSNRNGLRQIIFLTGAGISAPSGVHTFRESNGLWQKHNVELACTTIYRHSQEHAAFVNAVRRNVAKSHPNACHKLISKTQRKYGDHISVYTTNIDDLHEQCGTDVSHLHGKITHLRCESCEYKMHVGTGFQFRLDIPCPLQCKPGACLRTDVVLFNEDCDKTYELLRLQLKTASEDTLFIVIGSSMLIGIWQYVLTDAQKIFVNTDLSLCHEMADYFDIVICGDCCDKRVLQQIQHCINTHMSAHHVVSHQVETHATQQKV